MPRNRVREIAASAFGATTVKKDFLMKAKGNATQWLRATTRVEKALQDAHEHARRTGDYLAQPDHVLLALITEPQSLSTRLLLRMGVSPPELRAAIAAREGQNADRDGAQPTEQAWTDNRFNLLYAAREEARGMGDTYVGTEHLLLSLLREGQPNSPALLSLGVTWQGVADAIQGDRFQATEQRSVAAEAAAV